MASVPTGTLISASSKYKFPCSSLIFCKRSVSPVSEKALRFISNNTEPGSIFSLSKLSAENTVIEFDNNKITDKIIHVISLTFLCCLNLICHFPLSFTHYLYWRLHFPHNLFSSSLSPHSHTHPICLAGTPAIRA